MARFLSLLLMVWPLALGGCSNHDHYEIKLRPEGDSIRRELTCWRESRNDKEPFGEFDARRLKAIARAYGGRVGPLAARHTYEATFGPDMPADLGSGSGSYVVHRTSLGSVSSYEERFAGRDDLAGQLADRERAIDERLAHLLGWIDLVNADGAEEVVELRRVVDVELRRDLRNLALYVWTTPPPKSRLSTEPLDILLNQETGMRLINYFVERGYFRRTSVPALVRGTLANNGVDQFLRHALLQKLGRAPDADLPQSLGFLASDAQLAASWAEYCRTRPDDLGHGDPRLPPGAEGAWEPQPLGDFVGELLVTAMAFHLFADSVELQLSLHTGREPFATSGDWRAESGDVRWSCLVTPDNGGWPTYCYAHWATPDPAAQERCFGRVVLDGASLQKYAFWLESLAPPEAQEWEQFLLTLQRGDRLKSAIEGFRFSSEQSLTEDAERWSRTGSRLLLEALEPNIEQPGAAP